MSAYRDIKTSRRLISGGIAIGYAIALAVAIANLNTEEGTLLSALAFLGWLAIPPSLAVTSLDRRPSLLAVAAMGAVLQGVILITSIGLLEVVPAILWYLAVRRRPREAVAPRGAFWIRPLLGAATLIPLLVLLVHLDPLCTVTSPDGSVVRTYVEDGARTGWSFQLGGIASTSGSGSGETTTCTNDTIFGWEAAVSVTLSVLYVALIVTFWPTADQLARTGPSRSAVNSA
jgi:hypothetical protein